MHGVGGAEQQFLPQEIIFFAEFLCIYFFLWSTAIGCFSTPPQPGLLPVGRGRSLSLRLCQVGRHGWQHNAHAGSGAPPRTDVTLRGQSRTTQPCCWPQAAPACTPSDPRPRAQVGALPLPALRISALPTAAPAAADSRVPALPSSQVQPWPRRVVAEQQEKPRSLGCPPSSAALSLRELRSDHPVSMGEMQV